MNRRHCLGIDAGTTGVRAALTDADGRLLARAGVPLPGPEGRAGAMEQDPGHWWGALADCLGALRRHHPLTGVGRLAVAGTSGSVLLCDPHGRPLGPALLYGDRRARDQAGRIASVAPADSPARGPTSGLAHALWLVESLRPEPGFLVAHQADWLTGRLTGRWGRSDWHNALKTGFDPRIPAWPDWITGLGLPPAALPRVLAPGTPLGPVSPAAARGLDLPADAQVVAGTTDSVAGFLATGAGRPGDGVTSLGTTLALKLLSPRAVFDAGHGVYSHRLGEVWLAGGASNSGGAALLKYFDLVEIETLTPRLHPERPTGLDYYPLPGPGERFPVADPDYAGRVDPVPEDRAVFLQALMEGVAAVERWGYELLAALGAPPLARLFTVGGAARNPAWRAVRQRVLGVPLVEPESGDAAAGAARLAAGRLPGALHRGAE